METVNLAKKLIDNSRNILILPCSELQGDNLGSALALFYTLKKLGKNVNLNMGEAPEKFKFLTESQPSPSDNFVISVNTENKEISKLRYEKNGKDLKIYLALNKGQLESGDISFPSSVNSFKENPDLLVAVGAQSLEDIPGHLWELPILNIDNSPQNENFGEINLVGLTSSLSETAVKLVSAFGEDIFDKKISNCLLTGMIWSSQNFRNPKTRPATFQTSAFLIEKGADHQEIIQRLYKQKSLSQIKLLGKVLEKMTFYEPKEIYSANIAESDFKDCQASSKDLAFVVEELKFHFRHLPNLLLLWESHASPPITKGIFYSPSAGPSEKILENFTGISKGSGALFVVKETNLNIAKEQVLNIL